MSSMRKERQKKKVTDIKVYFQLLIGVDDGCFDWFLIWQKDYYYFLENTMACAILVDTMADNMADA